MDNATISCRSQRKGKERRVTHLVYLMIFETFLQHLVVSEILVILPCVHLDLVHLDVTEDRVDDLEAHVGPRGRRTHGRERQGRGLPRVGDEGRYKRFGGGGVSEMAFRCLKPSQILLLSSS